ncbi:hypothetical protein X777_14517 [Ooceraea biroi]|uniref:Uncharacterized protein n=1 Tax=Ooceraea biroi TaxID=2015173 RepID=A0A026VWP5_OOCBI|nr:hypothetical protein X777_14517 [Ooceraea biroi]
MKLDVSDVLYDSSSVSSDSGTSQSSRVSHDFLSSIANTAVLPNSVSTYLCIYLSKVPLFNRIEEVRSLIFKKFTHFLTFSNE